MSYGFFLDESPIAARKRELRKKLREVQAEVEPGWISQASEKILQAIREHATYRAARCIMCYVSTAREVATHRLLSAMLSEGKRVAIPWCEGDALRLFRFTGFEELEPGTLGILEPLAELRADPARQIRPDELDLILVPGLAFDLCGGRLGRGKGYYDRFLKTIPRSAVRIGLAFEYQILDEVPTTPSDEKMDWIITEKGVYRLASQ